MDINIKFEFTEEIIVKADIKRLEQVIYNLVNNAINYTGEDRKVWLSIKENKKDYLVEIKDSGKGIKEEELEHISMFQDISAEAFQNQF